MCTTAVDTPNLGVSAWQSDQLIPSMNVNTLFRSVPLKGKTSLESSNSRWVADEVIYSLALQESSGHGG